MTMEVPEHLRSGPLAEAAQRALQAAQAMASSSNSVPRVSLRGREFRFIDSGEEIAKFRDSVDVHILGVEPEAGRMIKTFYKNGYTSGAKEPPTCSSESGIAPNDWSSEKQNPTCNDCPKNKFGSAVSPNGKQTKACRDSKRIWIKMAKGNHMSGGPGQPAKEFDPGEFEDATLFGMNITVASLKAFSEYGKELASLGQGPAVCITRIKMLDMEFPQIDFELASWVDATIAPKALMLSDRKPWRIQYANAGLALSAPDGSVKSSLPTTLPGVPAHLRQPTEMTPSQEVLPPANARPVGDIDDAIKTW